MQINGAVSNELLIGKIFTTLWGDQAKSVERVERDTSPPNYGKPLFDGPAFDER